MRCKTNRITASSSTSGSDIATSASRMNGLQVSSAQ
jgi:hypothetical protein